MENVYLKDNSYLTQKWEMDLSQSLENLIVWQNRFLMSFQATLDTKIRTFQFKFLHRRIATNSFLCKIGVKTSPTCNFCNDESQTLLHLFFLCKEVSLFWTELSSWLKNLKTVDSSFVFSCLDICFGIVSKDSNLLNTLIFYGKHYIFRSKYQDRKPSLECFKIEIAHLEKVEKIIALRKGTVQFHKEKWKKLHPNV